MKIQSTILGKCGEITFSDADVINYDSFIPEGEFNPHNVRPWLLHDHGFVLAIVFADCEQDAIDEAVDQGKLDRYRISEADLADYKDGEGISYLGNAGEPFDIDTLGMIAMQNPPASFAAQWNAVNS